MTYARKLISAALALSLLGGTAATADAATRDFGRNDNHAQDNRGAPGRGGAPDHFGGGIPNRGGDPDRFGGGIPNRGGDSRFGFGFGPGFNRFGPSWHVGQRFSPYGLSYFVVDDWYRYHLRRPPIGYQWVEVNGDFLLVGITSGLIADLFLNPYGYY